MPELAGGGGGGGAGRRLKIRYYSVCKLLLDYENGTLFKIHAIVNYNLGKDGRYTKNIYHKC